MAGNFVNTNALAAVGATTAVSVFFTLAITGFTQGLSILAAQRFGSGDRAGLRPILSSSRRSIKKRRLFSIYAQ